MKLSKPIFLPCALKKALIAKTIMGAAAAWVMQQDVTSCSFMLPPRRPRMGGLAI
ncbi:MULTISPECIES: hypothetical protein [Bordetella]|uniref:hypothetical protein n=1 Tax=Bordetella TaxID=517 RepID=UPI001378E4D1|nr:MULTISPECIES: hypothetical protein [Bordetella]ULY30409.1 hypothetical protein HRK05_18760 [Bordetella pertussis]